MNFMKNREFLANTDIEKAIFFENWDCDNILEIANMLKNGKLSKIHELSFNHDIKILLNYISENNISSRKVKFLIRDYWSDRAKYILSSYKNYSISINGIQHKINLLSESGEKLYLDIISKKEIDAFRLESVANKDKIDLKLFADLNFDPNDFANQPYKFLSPISGCPNKCSYCAENATTKIYSMPYLVYMKILLKYITAEEKNSAHIGPHNDSESHMYFDKIMNADLGDISYYCSRYQIKPSILTKGINLGGRMDLAISKRYYSRNTPSVINICISLLDCDDKNANLKMAENLQSVARLYNSSHRIGLKIFASPDNFIKYADKIRNLKGRDGGLKWAALEPVGRAKDIKEAYIRLSCEEIEQVLSQAGFSADEVWTNMNEDFGHSRYLTADGHMQLDAFGNVYMKTADEQNLKQDVIYNIYDNLIKVR